MRDGAPLARKRRVHETTRRGNLRLIMRGYANKTSKAKKKKGARARARASAERTRARLHEITGAFCVRDICVR